MSALLSISHDLNALPRLVAETMLLRHFTGEVGAFLVEKESFLGNEKYFLAQAQSQGVAGFGRGPTKRKAFIKAIAEFYERRLMFDAFAKELSHIPRALQTSNGFAVHLSQDLANLAATHEAMERHLLQYSFFKNGWDGFEMIDKKAIGEESLIFVATRYAINGCRAGMVLATSTRFPGISFGYFADQSKNIEHSARWSHAIFEALDKIEPFLKLAQSLETDGISPIERGALRWMMTPHEDLHFLKGGIVQELPSANMEIIEFNLAARWGFDFPLFGSYCSSDAILPLFIMDRINEADIALVLASLQNVGLPAQVPKRNPVL